MSDSHSVLTVPAAPGDLLSTTVDQFSAHVQAALAHAGDAHLLELDLRAARMIDSVGLNLLVTLIKQAQARGGRVRLRIAHPNVRRILAFTRIDQHAEISP